MRAEFEEVIELAIRAAARGIRVALPARVERVEHAAGRVAVKIELRRPRTDPELEPDEDPVIPDVPVMFPSSGAVEVSYQIDVGDHGLVLFADFALGVWLQNGELVSPGPGEAHGLSGAVFVPGLWPDGEQVAVPSSGLIAGLRGGERLEVEIGQVRAGAGAFERAIKGDTYVPAERTFLLAEQAFLKALSIWVAAVGVTVPGPTATFQTAITAYDTAVTAFDTTVGVSRTAVTRVK